MTGPDQGLPPLDNEGVLWVAALDRVPICERIEWVSTILARVEEINAQRASLPGSGSTSGPDGGTVEAADLPGLRCFPAGEPQ